jgi:hypothetical protein
MVEYPNKCMPLNVITLDKNIRITKNKITLTIDVILLLTITLPIGVFQIDHTKEMIIISLITISDFYCNMKQAIFTNF